MELVVSPSGTGRAQAANAGEYLTFRLGTEEYGIDILKVQEIRSYEAPTRIANAPEFIKGVVNLRGVIVPIVDLRVKARLPECRGQQLHCGDRAQRQESRRWCRRRLGLRRARARQGADQAGARDGHVDGRHELHHRIATVNERMLILMDIEGLMSSADMGLISAIA